MPVFSKVRLSRRELLKKTGIFSTAGAMAGALPLVHSSLLEAAPTTTSLVKRGTEKENLFTEIGVRPLINGRGTFTLISGSRSLPEVKQAMYEASFYFVHLEEMMDGIGAELAKLTGAEWGITTTGCEAAICLATIACIAGTDVEKCQALPYVMKKNQVLIPKHSRNPYDVGVRMVGAELVEFSSPEELQAKLTDQVAMIYVLASPESYHGPLSIKAICDAAKAKDVPVFVDAAAEEPLKPNIHIEAGASLVGYSGGKCLRGPQSSGMLIGKKDLCQAAYFNAAPHHCYGRAFKCSKEEAMGLLAAVRQWYKRDHDAEQRAWTSWMQQIADKVKDLPSLRYKIIPYGEDLSNKAPHLQIEWDATILKITGTELIAKLDAGNPRILVDGGRGVRPHMMQSSINIMSYMLEADEIPVIADAIYQGLTTPGKYHDPVIPQEAPASIAGAWQVSIQYVRGEGQQTFRLQQNGTKISGQQKGEIYEAQLEGIVLGNTVELTSSMPVSGNSIPWKFRGMMKGSTMSGRVSMGEYGEVPWKAIRL